MPNLKTIFSSNIPVDCHIIKGRLEAEGIDAFIWDENIVWVDPFKAVAIGGVKLKISDNQIEKAWNILESLKTGKLIDESGSYDLSEAFENEIQHQNEVLKIKSQIRHNLELLNKPEKIKSLTIGQPELTKIMDAEKKFREIFSKRKVINWKEIFNDLFDPEKSLLDYARPIPVEAYLEKEIVENHECFTNEKTTVSCPHCDSENTRNGVTVNFKWRIPYIILSVLFLAPWPIYWRSYYCFDCGKSFKVKTNL